MVGRHTSSSHHVSSPFNSNISTTNNQHHPNHNHNHHTSSRLTRGTVNPSTSSTGGVLGQQQDMHRVPTFPIDPNLGGPSATHNANTTNNTTVLSTSTNQPLPSFQHHYDTRPQSGGGGDPRAQYNSYNTPDYHQHTTPTQQQQPHQTPQTDYSGYDTSFATEDQGTPTQILAAQQPSTTITGTPITDPESQEIRRLAFAALTESVEVLANRTRAEENGPNGEKARQMFGMSWLMRNCEVSTGATPRNRVYARYVSLCAMERLKPLNPASFGKLVRAVYPDIKTRRLGVRGQSKYHYCGIKLRDDDPNAPTPDISGDVEEFPLL